MSRARANQAVARTLYRELLRSTRRIDAVMTEAHAPMLEDALERHGLEGVAAGALSSTEMVREAFRAPRAASCADLGFAAVRCAGETLAWLPCATKLHALAYAGAPVEEGAFAIADAIEVRARHDRGAPVEVARAARLQLDALAEAVRRASPDEPRPEPPDGAAADAPEADARDGGSGRLGTLERINAVLYGEGGALERVGTGSIGGRGTPRPTIEDASSVSRVLARRGSGLPIALCSIYQAVAARLGLELRMTNFPQRVLLRLEAAGADASAGGGADADADDGALWFVDPAARGKILLPPAECEAVLRRARLPRQKRAEAMAAAGAPRVWARMLRNLEMHATHEGRHDEAVVWRNMGHGLDQFEGGDERPRATC